MTIIISIFRTDNAVKNRWHSSMRSKTTRKGSDASDGEAASKENKMNRPKPLQIHSAPLQTGPFKGR